MKLLYRGLLLLFFLIIITSYYFINFIQIDDLPSAYYVDPSNESAKYEANLYFVGEQGLLIEKRSLLILDESIEKSLLMELQKGARDTRKKSIFDFDIELESIDTIDDSHYVNLKVNRDGYRILNEDHFHLYVWSVVNTLTEHSPNSKVQFFFNGEKIFKEIQDFNFSQPLPRLEKLIYVEEPDPADIVIDFINYLTIGRYDESYELLSDVSQANMNYAEFKVISKELIHEISQYEQLLYYTQKYDTYWNVVIKYESENEEVLYKNWKVISDSGQYRIIFRDGFIFN